MRRLKKREKCRLHRPGRQLLENIANSRKINKVYLCGQEVGRAALKAKWQARWKTAVNTK